MITVHPLYCETSRRCWKAKIARGTLSVAIKNLE